MKILVIGGNGFVGKNLTTVLQRKGHAIVPLSRRDGLSHPENAL